MLIWPHSKSGEYTVKSGYHIIRGMEQTDANTASTSFDIDKKNLEDYMASECTAEN